MGRKLTGIALQRKRNAEHQKKIRAERDANGLCRTCGDPAKRVRVKVNGVRTTKILRQCIRHLRVDAQRHQREYPLDVSRAPRAPRNKAPKMEGWSAYYPLDGVRRKVDHGGIPGSATDGDLIYPLEWLE